MTKHKYLFWSLCSACQLRCRYCFYEGMNDKAPGVVKLSDAKTALHNLGDRFDNVTFTGGEPLINPWFWEIVREVRASGRDVSFLTNGISLGIKEVRNLQASGISRIGISLDSVTPEINDNIRKHSAGRKVSRGIIDNIRFLAGNRSDGLEINILQTVCRRTIREIGPMMEFCRELNLKLSVHLADIPVFYRDTLDIRIDSLSPEERSALLKTLLNWAGDNKKLVKYVHMVTAIAEGKNVRGLKCPMGSAAFYLDADGCIYPCFHRKDLLLGNVYKSSFKKLIASKRFPDLERATCVKLACTCFVE